MAMYTETTMVLTTMVSHHLATRTTTITRTRWYQLSQQQVHTVRLEKFDQAEVAARVLKAALTTVVDGEEGTGRTEVVGREVLEKKLPQLAELQLPASMNDISKRNVRGRHEDVSEFCAICFSITDDVQAKNSKVAMAQIPTKISTIRNNSHTLPRRQQRMTLTRPRLVSILRAASSRLRQVLLHLNSNLSNLQLHTRLEPRTIQTTSLHLLGQHQYHSTTATSPVAAMQILMRLTDVALMRM